MTTITKTETVSPSIYVSCLAAYNSGVLHGRWVDLTNGEDATATDIREMLATSPVADAEEYAIHDFEGFGSYKVSEWSDVATLVAIAEAVDEHGPFITEYLADVHDDLADAIAAVDEVSSADSFRDFSDDFVDSCLLIDDPASTVARYFDYESFARDLQHDYTVLDDPDGGVFVLSNCR